MSMKTMLIQFTLRDQASLMALTDDVIKTSEIEGEQLMIISPQSPIGALLMHKGVGEVFSFRGKDSVIEVVM